MMNVEPACRFCQGNMLCTGGVIHANNTESYSYECKRCHSEQDFESTGRPLDYKFVIGRYHLLFKPRNKTFQIIVYPIDEVWLQKASQCLLNVNFCPTHLTPQNTTEERIKTLILFS